MAALITAFVRNGACVLRALLPNNALLHSVAVVGAPYPLNEVTRVEWVVAVTQLMAIYFFSSASYSDVTQGLVAYRRGSILLVELDRLAVQGLDHGHVEHTVLSHALRKARAEGLSRFWVGVCEFVLAAGYIVLLANSLHIRGPTHPKPVIDALLVMETFFVYILVVMWRAVLGFFSTRASSSALLALLQRQQSRGAFSGAKVLQLAAESGFLDNDRLCDVCTAIDPKLTLRLVGPGDAVEGLHADLLEIRRLVTLANPLGKGKGKGKGEAPVDENELDLRDRVMHTVAVRASVCDFEAAGALVFFALNVGAFYGYLLSILAFYFPYASLQSAQPVDVVARVLMLGLSNASADWGGSLVGDFCWTVEPVLTLVYPVLLRAYTQRARLQVDHTTVATTGASKAVKGKKID